MIITKELEEEIAAWNETDFPAMSPITLIRELFNTRFIHITSLSIVIDKLTGQQIPIALFEKEVYRHVLCTTPEGKVLKAATASLSWEGRNRLTEFTYEPGEEAVHLGKWNLWRPSGIKAIPGNVQPWNDLLDHLFVGKPAWERKYFEQWCAYPLQRLGTKMHVAVLMYGKERLGSIRIPLPEDVISDNTQQDDQQQTGSDAKGGGEGDSHSARLFTQ